MVQRLIVTTPWYISFDVALMWNYVSFQHGFDIYTGVAHMIITYMLLITKIIAVSISYHAEAVYMGHLHLMRWIFSSKWHNTFIYVSRKWKDYWVLFSYTNFSCRFVACFMWPLLVVVLRLYQYRYDELRNLLIYNQKCLFISLGDCNSVLI